MNILVGHRPLRWRTYMSRAALALAFTLAPTLARADYRIEPGDTLSLTVAGAPELAVKAPVDIDGNVSLPLVGPLSVAGSSVADALAKVQSIMPGRQFHRRNSDGREFPVIIAPSEISLSVQEYRPIYMNGDVAKPGKQTYLPGLTVRKAIALAGGFDVLRFKMDNPFLQLADLTGEYNRLWVEYANQQSVVARLQAERDGKQDLDADTINRMPIAPGLAADLLTSARGQLALRNADFTKEVSFLKKAVGKENDRVGILRGQERNERAGLDDDAAELQQYQEAYRKGTVILPRLSEARRTVLLSSTRVLQTTALLASVEREQQNLGRRLDHTGDARRIQILTGLQNATAELAVVRAKLQAVSEKLRYTGMVKSQLVRGPDSHPDIFITRAATNGRARIRADMDSLVEPGDTIEVALQIETSIPGQ